MSLHIGKQASGFLAVTLFAGSVYAGTYTESTRIDLRDPKAPSQVEKMWFDGARMRAQAGSDGRFEIFKEEALYMVEPAKKSYTVMDRATIVQLSGRLAALREQLQSRLAALPADQRAVVEKMMGPAASALVAPPAAAPITVKETSMTGSAAGISCTVWDISRADLKVQELCVAPAASVPGGAPMMAVMKVLGATFKQLAGSLGNLVGNDSAAQSWSNLEAINGIPLITRTFAEGKPTSEWKLRRIRAENIPASTFDVPAGYTRRALAPASGAIQ